MSSKHNKKILITAKNSYIGNSFAAWVADRPEYTIDFISCRTDEWRKQSFSGYDVVLHVAGIAHVEAKAEQEDLYYRINRDLTVELANKAKQEGVNQFVFLSSMIVFGESNTTTPYLIVNNGTRVNPASFYGSSKAQAEEGILLLENEKFAITIIRPPMVYGVGSKGNFPRLLGIARKTFIFPLIDNNRSAIYIDNLCEFIHLIIKNNERGIFHPQNKEYLNTSELIEKLADSYKKKIVFVKSFNIFVALLAKKLNTVNKVFGTYTYEQEMSQYKEEYRVVSLDESIKLVCEVSSEKSTDISKS